MTILVIVFMGIFIMILAGLTGLVLQQNKVQKAKENQQTAIQIAEAGLDYYKWFLAHYPSDLQDGTGAPGPYEHEYFDPEGGAIGKFSLNITGNMQCGAVMSIDIESTGWTYDDPTYKRVVTGRYARPSVAEYSYILDSGVWWGGGALYGRFHSNYGIRMDGGNLSKVTSAVEDWLCTSSYGCNPDETKDGVWGAGDPSLWEFPTTPIDFVGITQDLVDMKAMAQSDGVYLGTYGGASGKKGFHLIFKADGSVDVYKTNNVSYQWGYDADEGWVKDYHIINSQIFDGNYTIPNDCALVYSETKVWLEGVIPKKITVVAANTNNPSWNPDIYLYDDITYVDTDGTDGLTAIAERNVLIPYSSPNNLTVHGIFVAQTGRYGRNLYLCNLGNAKRGTLDSFGTIVSAKRPVTYWMYWYPGCGSNWSGYSGGSSSYDSKLAKSPPPLTPFADDEFRFIEWRED